MKYFKHFLYFIPVLSFLLSSCETDISLNLPEGQEKLVVEGHIEPGMAPYLLLTKSSPYFASTNIFEVANSFVHNAVIKVSNGTDTVLLVETTLASLPDSNAKKMMDFFQIESKTLSSLLNLSFYTTSLMKGEVGKTYTLSVDVQGIKLNSVTTIPKLVIPDSFYVMPPDNDSKNDSMMKLYFAFKDPINEVNFYRYFTKRNSGPYYTDRWGSVFDDNLVNGQNIKWNLSRGTGPNDSLDKEVRGLFMKGDTVIVKFCTLDAAHFSFFQTFESGKFGGGTYSNPIQIKSNIVGGLGIWGGYGSIYHKIIIPK